MDTEVIILLICFDDQCSNVYRKANTGVGYLMKVSISILLAVTMVFVSMAASKSDAGREGGSETRGTWYGAWGRETSWARESGWGRVIVPVGSSEEERGSSEEHHSSEEHG